MKYYAVTEDPNELLHDGVKGMKWGQHLFGDDLRPKSAGYKRALGKQRKAASKKAASVQSAVKKSSVQLSMNRQRKQQDKYNRAMQKAQRRMELVENLRNIDQARVYERGIDRQYHQEVRAAKNQNKLNRVLDKQANRYERNERKMDKYLQQARQGKLKYGKLSDDQVQRVTQRLNMESNARKLGSAEKTWRQQKKEAFRKGKLSGIERGTAAAMEEVARAGTIYGIQNFMNRKKRNALAKQQGKETRIKNKEQNKKTHKDIRQEVKQEAYEAEIRSGKSLLERSTNPFMSTASAAKRLQENRERLSDQEFNLNEKHYALQAERQNRENLERAEEQRKLAGKMAYEFGYLPSGSLGKQNSQNNQQGQGKKKNNQQQGLSGLSNNKEEVDAWKEWYERVVLDGQTNQQKEAAAKAKAAKAERANKRKQKMDNFFAPLDRLQNRIDQNAKERREMYSRLVGDAQQAREESEFQKELNAELERKAAESRRASVDRANTSTKKKQNQKKKSKLVVNPNGGATLITPLSRKGGGK